MTTSRGPLVISNRTLAYSGTTKPQILDLLDLNNVFEHLTKLETIQHPVDLTLSPSSLQVAFSNGVMTASYGPDRYRFLSAGASQFASEVLPSRMWPGIKTLIEIGGPDPKGEDIAALAWNKFARTNHKPMRFRTIRANAYGVVSKCIRAVVSSTYGLYSNREFIADLRNHSEQFPRLPVLNWHLTDQGMRVTFVALDDAALFPTFFDPQALVGKSAIPVIHAWNSEVGRGKIGLRAGLYNVQTAGGLGTWDDSRDFTWIHRGVDSGKKLRLGMGKRYSILIEAAGELAAEYRKAQVLEVEDPDAWLKEKLGLMKDVIGVENTTEIINSLTHPNITPGNKLATLIDAITLVAGRQEDLFRKDDLEQAASRIMRMGLKELGG